MNYKKLGNKAFRNCHFEISWLCEIRYIHIVCIWDNFFTNFYKLSLKITIFSFPLNTVRSDTLYLRVECIGWPACRVAGYRMTGPRKLRLMLSNTVQRQNLLFSHSRPPSWLSIVTKPRYKLSYFYQYPSWVQVSLHVRFVCPQIVFFALLLILMLNNFVA